MRRLFGNDRDSLGCVSASRLAVDVLTGIPDDRRETVEDDERADPTKSIADVIAESSAAEYVPVTLSPGPIGPGIRCESSARSRRGRVTRPRWFRACSTALPDSEPKGSTSSRTENPARAVETPQGEQMLRWMEQNEDAWRTRPAL